MTEEENSMEASLSAEEIRAEALEKAVVFASEQIAGTVDRDITPEEAAQLGVDYVGYIHQSTIDNLRFTENFRQDIRELAGPMAEAYQKELENSHLTGALLTSLNHQPDVVGFKDYLMEAGSDYDKFARSADGDVDEELLRTSQGFTKVAGLIPETGFEAKAPVFAWMDPRFNGEADMPPPQQ